MSAPETHWCDTCRLMVPADHRHGAAALCPKHGCEMNDGRCIPCDFAFRVTAAPAPDVQLGHGLCPPSLLAPFIHRVRRPRGRR